MLAEITQALSRLRDSGLYQSRAVYDLAMLHNRYLPELSRIQDSMKYPHVMRILAEEAVEQLDLFTDYTARAQQRAAEEREEVKEKNIQHAMLDIQKKFGKNAILKGMDLQEGATARERNATIGGHKA